MTVCGQVVYVTFLDSVPVKMPKRYSRRSDVHCSTACTGFRYPRLQGWQCVRRIPQIRANELIKNKEGTHADEYAQWRYTKTNTNPNPDPNRYRRRCPDPNARIQKFIHYMATTPQLKNSMWIEFVHTHLHTTPNLCLTTWKKSFSLMLSKPLNILKTIKSPRIFLSQE